MCPLRYFELFAMKSYTVALLMLFTLSCTKETYVEGLVNLPEVYEIHITDMGYHSIQNHWKNTFLNPGYYLLACSDNAYNWSVLLIDGTQNYYLQDPATGYYLSLNDFGTVVLSYEASSTATWVLEKVDKNSAYMRLKNFSTNEYLHIENGEIECGQIKSDWWSAQWSIYPEF
jgi:hypothetical protein